MTSSFLTPTRPHDPPQAAGPASWHFAFCPATHPHPPCRLPAQHHEHYSPPQKQNAPFLVVILPFSPCPHSLARSPAPRPPAQQLSIMSISPPQKQNAPFHEKVHFASTPLCTGENDSRSSQTAPVSPNPPFQALFLAGWVSCLCMFQDCMSLYIYIYLSCI